MSPPPSTTSTYEKHPAVDAGPATAVTVGWSAVAGVLRGAGRVLAVETYPGVSGKDVAALVAAVGADVVVDAADALRSAAEIDRIVGPDLTDDPVFGRLTTLTLDDLLDPRLVHALREDVRDASREGRAVLVVGTGATRIAPDDAVVVYADLARWEIQQRQRRNEVGNLGVDNTTERPAAKYKRGYFVDWRVADRHKVALFDHIAWFLDTTVTDRPLLVAAADVWRGLAAATRQPFRVVPFFDPAPWGGRWMKDVCGLDPEVDGYGWCFDCVPEENSLLLAFGEHRVELPALDLVLRHPRDLLGDQVVDRFGAEFPIRFDFLDTMGGGNLSLQVHPLTEYIAEHFGVQYTQDESYYLMDAEPGATVYLGVRGGVDPDAMAAELRAAQADGPSFAAERFVNRFPAKRHDHFLIPAGTVHCSGAGSMVLEISATPYIFTFKLWDWDRMGLDGRPRPIHLDHGLANIRWERDTAYARDHLVNKVTPLGWGPGWKAERTGLHEAEFIETHRHWFIGQARHERTGGVDVLNLVQGDEVEVVSPDGAWDPYVVHYAETFIVPAAAGPYVVRPTRRRRLAGTPPFATIKAFVRP